LPIFSVVSLIRWTFLPFFCSVDLWFCVKVVILLFVKMEIHLYCFLLSLARPFRVFPCVGVFSGRRFLRVSDFFFFLRMFSRFFGKSLFFPIEAFPPRRGLPFFSPLMNHVTLVFLFFFAASPLLSHLAFGLFLFLLWDPWPSSRAHSRCFFPRSFFLPS